MRLTEVLEDLRSVQGQRKDKTQWFVARETASKPNLTGATGRFFITPYAVKRYVERVRPGLTYSQALSELILLTNAGSLKGPYQGQKLPQQYPNARLELWRGPRVGPNSKQDRRSRLRFVVGHSGAGELPQVVTILPVPGRVLHTCKGLLEDLCQNPA